MTLASPRHREGAPSCRPRVAFASSCRRVGSRAIALASHRRRVDLESLRSRLAVASPSHRPRHHEGVSLPSRRLCVAYATRCEVFASASRIVAFLHHISVAPLQASHRHRVGVTSPLRSRHLGLAVESTSRLFLRAVASTSASTSADISVAVMSALMPSRHVDLESALPSASRQHSNAITKVSHWRHLTTTNRRCVDYASRQRRHSVVVVTAAKPSRRLRISVASAGGTMSV